MGRGKFVGDFNMEGVRLLEILIWGGVSLLEIFNMGRGKFVGDF
jgi:hypothetical protein